MDNVQAMIERARFTRGLLHPNAMPNISERTRPTAAPQPPLRQAAQPQFAPQPAPQQAAQQQFAPQPMQLTQPRRTLYTELMRKHDLVNPRIK